MEEDKIYTMKDIEKLREFLNYDKYSMSKLLMIAKYLRRMEDNDWYGSPLLRRAFFKQLRKDI